MRRSLSWVDRGNVHHDRDEVYRIVEVCGHYSLYNTRGDGFPIGDYRTLVGAKRAATRHAYGRR